MGFPCGRTGTGSTRAQGGEGMVEGPPAGSTGWRSGMSCRGETGPGICCRGRVCGARAARRGLCGRRSGIYSGEHPHYRSPVTPRPELTEEPLARWRSRDRGQLRLRGRPAPAGVNIVGSHDVRGARAPACGGVGRALALPAFPVIRRRVPPGESPVLKALVPVPDRHGAAVSIKGWPVSKRAAAVPLTGAQQ